MGKLKNNQIRALVLTLTILGNISLAAIPFVISPQEVNVFVVLLIGVSAVWWLCFGMVSALVSIALLLYPAYVLLSIMGKE